MFRGALMILNRVPQFSKWRAQLVERMDHDIALDNFEARRDFGYDPR